MEVWAVRKIVLGKLTALASPGLITEKSFDSPQLPLAAPSLGALGIVSALTPSVALVSLRPSSPVPGPCKEVFSDN